MIDVMEKIYFGDTGSGDFLEVTVDSIQNLAIHIGNESIHGNRRWVIYEQDVHRMIEGLQKLQATYFK